MRCRPLMPERVDALPPSAAGAGRISPGAGARPAGRGRHVRFRRVGRLYPVKAAAGIGGEAAVSRGRAGVGVRVTEGARNHEGFVAAVTIRID